MYIIKVCDLCRVEHSDKETKRHWADVIEPGHLNLKTHVAIQREYRLDVCYNCAKELNSALKQTIELLKGVV